MTNTPNNAAAATTAEIAAEIEETRAALGETVAALAAKADVKARVTESLSETRSEIASGISHTAGRVAGVFESFADRVRRNPLPWVLGVAAIVITLVAVRSRRR